MDKEGTIPRGPQVTPLQEVLVILLPEEVRVGVGVWGPGDSRPSSSSSFLLRNSEWLLAWSGPETTQTPTSSSAGLG